MVTPTPPSGTPTEKVRWGNIALVLLGVVAAVITMNWASEWINSVVGEREAMLSASGISPVLIGALILYALLIAVPFMPGIEVGVALLMIQGAAIAPLVYVATVTGLLIAFAIGSFVPLDVLARAFGRLGLKRARDFVTKTASLTPEDRLARQRAALPKWLGRPTVDYRYVTLGALLNVPGTFAIGGGGGILMVAGLSRVFNGWLVLVTLLIATLPVPLTVWMMGGSMP